jgi:hypothetical protein
MKQDEFSKGEIVIYKSKEGPKLEVHLKEEIVWLTQKQMALLFDKGVPTINEHIKNIYKEGELDEKSTIRNFRITASDGKSYKTNFKQELIFRLMTAEKPFALIKIGDISGWLKDKLEGYERYQKKRLQNLHNARFVKDQFFHIINVDSEVKFIEQLEDYLAKPDNVFRQFDWWMFSKLDQTLDKVFIPYYNPKENNIANFKPDFIFWMQKGKRYLILFVDPKGTEHADGYRKIDGYSRIFENEKGGQKVSRDFAFNGFTINVKLLMKPKAGIAGVLKNYESYWFDNFADFARKIS